MYPEALISLGFIEITAYGLMNAIGYLMAGFYLYKTQAKSPFKNNTELFDYIFYLILGALIGAKIFYIIFHWSGFYGDNIFEKLIDAIKTFRSGFVYFGGFVGAVCSGVYFIRKRNFPISKTADFTAPAIALGHLFGRIGCFLAGCCYGEISHSKLAIKFSNPECLVPHHLHNIPLHPTQLYEIFANLLIFLTLHFLNNKKHKTGSIFVLYMAMYSVARFGIEFFRGDERGNFIFSISPSQLISIVIFITAILIYILAIRNKKNG